MAVETHGVVQLRGTSKRVPVTVRADQGRLRVATNNEVIGDWDVSAIGIQALNDGFSLRVEGEEMILKTENDPGIAEEIGMMAASPRLARRLAASHPLAEREPAPEPAPTKSNLGPILFALGGALILAGGFFLRQDTALTANENGVAQGLSADGRFWLAFVIGGLIMAFVGYMLALGPRWARLGAGLVLLAVVILFGVAASTSAPAANHLLAYGFVAGGIVVGIAVIFSENLNDGG